jgi:hypothetical protein
LHSQSAKAPGGFQIKFFGAGICLGLPEAPGRAGGRSFGDLPVKPAKQKQPDQLPDPAGS